MLDLPTVLVAFATVALPGCGQAMFACTSDLECVSNGFSGMCQPSGYCSFEDPDCASGQRYGRFAPPSIAQSCVDSGGSATEVTSDAPDDTTRGSEGPVTTSVGVDESSSSTSGSEPDLGEGSSTGAPDCCEAGCACAGDCLAAQIGGPSGAEAIGVAVVGEHVVWSTGYGKTLRIADPQQGAMDIQLASLWTNNFATRIAADDTHVYVLDWGGGAVRRVSVPGGVVDLVGTVADGQAEFGGIAVADEHVYFAMRTTGGIWRAAKDLSQANDAELVAAAVLPNDVAVDDTHVYWIDNDAQELRRLAFADAGGEGERIATGPGLEVLIVDDTHVYYAGGGTVIAAIKDADGQGMIELAADQGPIFDMAADSTHVYWTASANDKVVAMRKDGSGSALSIATSPTPWGLALGCDAVYWAENGTGTLQMRGK